MKIIVFSLLCLGDGALTPAVSVLSAVEGLALNAPNLRRWVVPITVVIIFSLFLSQQWGTAKIGQTRFLLFSSNRRREDRLVSFRFRIDIWSIDVCLV